MSEKLSKSFTVAEFLKSQTAVRRGIDNTFAAPEHKEAAKLLCENVLQKIRDGLGKVVIISSGYRSSTLNKEVGGSATSQHCFGQAADIEVPGISTKALAVWIFESGIDFDQMILEFYDPKIPDSGWVHISFKASGNRKDIKSATRDANGKTVYTPGLI